MKIERVMAPAFGPFVGENLALMEGMNLVWGPNEAGKSSWHAALYFGLCGRKRGSGQPSREDRELRSRHEPWDGAGWAAGAIVSLEDGRRIELRHDLRGLTDCYAQDLGLGGRDCSGEIIVGNDAPDGARWLGLDRRTFLTVACVRQGDLLAVRANGRLVQDHLQRGAATGGADESAAAALERIAQYRREQVGAGHRAAVGPLRRATVAVERARAALETARAEHSSYRWLLTRQHELDDAEMSARGVLYRTEVARAKVEASPPARALQERADVARRYVEEVSARRPSQRLLLGALITAIAGVTVGVFVHLLAGHLAAAHRLRTGHSRGHPPRPAGDRRRAGRHARGRGDGRRRPRGADSRRPRSAHVRSPVVRGGGQGGCRGPGPACRAHARPDERRAGGRVAGRRRGRVSPRRGPGAHAGADPDLPDGRPGAGPPQRRAAPRPASLALAPARHERSLHARRWSTRRRWRWACGPATGRGARRRCCRTAPPSRSTCCCASPWSTT